MPAWFLDDCAPVFQTEAPAPVRAAPIPETGGLSTWVRDDLGVASGSGLAVNVESHGSTKGRLRLRGANGISQVGKPGETLALVEGEEYELDLTIWVRRPGSSWSARKEPRTTACRIVATGDANDGVRVEVEEQHGGFALAKRNYCWVRLRGIRLADSQMPTGFVRPWQPDDER
jgi:hypothetical protein